jgi:hypothetical protein
VTLSTGSWKKNESYDQDDLRASETPTNNFNLVMLKISFVIQLSEHVLKVK